MSVLSPGQFEMMPTSEVAKLADPNVPFHKVREQEGPYLEHLRNSVREHGIQEPLIIKGNTLHEGTHRTIVAQDLGLSHLPVRRI